MLLGLHEVSHQFKVRLLLVLFTQVINKHHGMNGSINLESLIEMPYDFGRQNADTRKKMDI